MHSDYSKVAGADRRSDCTDVADEARAPPRNDDGGDEQMRIESNANHDCGDRSEEAKGVESTSTPPEFEAAIFSAPAAAAGPAAKQAEPSDQAEPIDAAKHDGGFLSVGNGPVAPPASSDCVKDRQVDVRAGPGYLQPVTALSQNDKSFSSSSNGDASIAIATVAVGKSTQQLHATKSEVDDMTALQKRDADAVATCAAQVIDKCSENDSSSGSSANVDVGFIDAERKIDGEGQTASTEPMPLSVTSPVDGNRSAEQPNMLEHSNVLMSLPNPSLKPQVSSTQSPFFSVASSGEEPGPSIVAGTVVHASVAINEAGDAANVLKPPPRASRRTVKKSVRALEAEKVSESVCALKTAPERRVVDQSDKATRT